MINKYYSSTKITSLAFDELIELGTHLFEFCYITLGVNNRKKEYPTLSINVSPIKGAIAQYNPDDNMITIFTKNAKTLGELTSSYIHEYTHYLQPCKTKYHKLLKQYGYEKHPFEVEARANEKKYNRIILNHIRKNITK